MQAYFGGGQCKRAVPSQQQIGSGATCIAHDGKHPAFFPSQLQGIDCADELVKGLDLPATALNQQGDGLGGGLGELAEGDGHASGGGHRQRARDFD